MFAQNSIFQEQYRAESAALANKPNLEQGGKGGGVISRLQSP